MVGVPTSKACNTCRQRRIACSLERPKCSQCVKSDRVCGGYQRERKFVANEGVIKDGKVYTTSIHARKIENGSLPDTNRKQTWLTRLGIRPDSSRGANRPLGPGMEIAPRTAYCQQITSAFLYSYLPKAQDAANKSWMVMIQELASPSPALQVSFLALSTARIGRLQGDSVMVKESLKLYTKGLCELQKALSSPKSLYSDETLGTCMALSMYELFECPAGSTGGYISHQEGCSRLVRLRGPEAHSSGLGHQIFLHFRVQEILHRLDQHSKTYLTDPEWMELPWKETSKGQLDQILSILALAPGIFECADGLKDMTSPTFITRVALLVNKCWKLDVDMQAFYRELEASQSGPLFWPRASTRENSADDLELGKVFPAVFAFPDLRLAITLMMYWSILLMLNHGLQDLHNLVDFIKSQYGDADNPADILPLLFGNGAVSNDNSGDANEPDSPEDLKAYWNSLPSLENREDPISIGRKICQSVEYCMQDDMLGGGPAIVVAPLNIMIATLKERPNFQREIRWASAILTQVRERGLRMLDVI